MARAPRVGAGKQRLAASIGRAAAWRINRALQAHTLRVACDPRWRSLLCVTPDCAVSLSLPNVWPARVVRVPQGRGDLGERMARMLGLCRDRECVAIIGVDCPGITRARIASAFRALKRRRFAIGPSPDGGFWLIATRRARLTAGAFRGVRWSTPHALADVTNRLPEPPAMLAVLRDVDTIEDWRNAGPQPWR
jgi:rSAM/selenodomain-associated transferase 1